MIKFVRSFFKNLKDKLEYIKNIFHINYGWDISSTFHITKVYIKAYNQDEDSFIVVESNDDLKRQYMIPRSNIVFPLTQQDKESIEAITNVPFIQNGYCIKNDNDAKKEIVECKIIGLIENQYLLVEYIDPYLDMALAISYDRSYKILKIKEFMVRKN